MSDYIGMLGQSVFEIIICLVVMGSIIGAVVWLNHRQKKQPDLRNKSDGKAEGAVIPGQFRELPESNRNKPKSIILGTGDYQCLCYRNHPRWGPSADYTKIPEVIGEIDMAETSAPLSGALLVVRELPDGKIVPYNEPRQKQIVDDETPEHAWILTHWPSARRFWTVATKWYQNMSNWYIIGSLAITFIALIITLGGGR